VPRPSKPPTQLARRTGHDSIAVAVAARAGRVARSEDERTMTTTIEVNDAKGAPFAWIAVERYDDGTSTLSVDIPHHTEFDTTDARALVAALLDAAVLAEAGA
jgi:hypothetical protein